MSGQGPKWPVNFFAYLKHWSGGQTAPPEGVSGKFWGRKREEKEGRKGKKEGKKNEKGRKEGEKKRRRGKGKKGEGKYEK